MEKTAATFTIIENWMTVQAYAKACGVVNRTVVERMERGDIAHVRIHKVEVIDVQASPPRKGMYGKIPRAQPFIWPPTMPPKEELVWIDRFATEQRVRTTIIYRAVLFGNIAGWGVSDKALVRRADALAAIGR